MRDPRDSPEYDLPPRDQVRRSYVIASLPRSGSTLLARALWDTGIAGAPGEYFNPRHMNDFLVRWGRIRAGGIARHVLGGPSDWRRVGTWRSLPIDEYVRALKRHRTGQNGVFGVKLHYGHLESAFLRGGLDVERALERPRWVWVVRHDRVRQAVSYVRALQTDHWRSSDAEQNGNGNSDSSGSSYGSRNGRGRAGYDFERIVRRLADLVTREQAWEHWLRAQRIEPLKVVYESFVESYEPTVRQVLRHLEIEDAETVAIRPAPLRRQSDGLTEQWIEEFRADVARRGRTVPGM